MSKNKKQDDIPMTFGPCRVLVAEDNHLVALGIGAMVEELGHKLCGIANDGEAAVAMASEHAPDLALLDIRMPKLSGIDVAMMLAQKLAVPSIIVSAYSDEEHIGRIQSFGSSSGVYGYLLKPVNKDDLRVTIAVARQRACVDEWLQDRVGKLEANLANRRLVEGAKWVLVQKHKLSEPEAHERLQRVARDRRMALADVAQGVIDRGELPE